MMKKKESTDAIKDHTIIMLIVLFGSLFILIIFILFFMKNRILDLDSKMVSDNVSSVILSENVEVISEKTFEHQLPSELSYNGYEKHVLKDGFFNAVIASSFLEKNGTKGSPNYAFDNDSNTCWQYSFDKNTLHECIIAYNTDGSVVNVSSVTISNGYQNTRYNTKSKDMYYWNSRVKEITIEFDDGSTERFTILDNKKAQVFHFNQRETCFIKFTVDEIYKGKKYNDVCVAEIKYQ